MEGEAENYIEELENGFGLDWTGCDKADSKIG
jgi:hypothetical protein